MNNALALPFLFLIIFFTFVFFAVISDVQTTECKNKGGEWILNFGCAKVERL